MIFARRHAARLRTFAGDESGGVAIVVALGASALIGFSAMALDIMSFYRTKRTLQTATDLAALAAAADPDNANAAAAATLAANGLSARITRLDQGTYNLDPSVPPAARFSAGGAPTNAVALATRSRSPVFFGKIFKLIDPSFTSPDGGVDIGAKAIGMRKATAGFGIGSRLLALNNGVLNALLTAQTGSNASLSLADYRSLAAAQVDLLSYSRSLATTARLSAEDYNSVLSASVASGTGLSTLASQAGSAITAAAGDFLRQAASSLAGSSLSPSALTSFGPYGSNALTTPINLSVSEDALGLLTGVAGLSANGRQTSAAIATGVPGLTANVSFVLGAPAQTTVAGLPGLRAATAQLKMQVTFGVAVPGLGIAQLPIAISAARATAQLKTISCPVNQNSAATATLGVTPAVATASVGTFTDPADLTSTSVRPAQILSLAGLASVTGSADAALGAAQATDVSFTMADVAAGTVKTVSSGSITGSLATTLIGRLQLNVTALGLGLGLDSAVTQPLRTALAAAAPTMDSLLASLLGAFGLGIGQADTWMTDIRCGSAVLIN